MGEDGRPKPGTGWCMLGAREGTDIRVRNGFVDPGHEGISVAPGDPAPLSSRHIPKRLGGRGPYELWSIGVEDLGAKLMCASYGKSTHGFIEPAYRMTLSDYQDALAETGARWRLVNALPNPR